MQIETSNCTTGRCSGGGRWYIFTLENTTEYLPGLNFFLIKAENVDILIRPKEETLRKSPQRVSGSSEPTDDYITLFKSIPEFDRQGGAIFRIPDGHNWIIRSHSSTSNHGYLALWTCFAFTRESIQEELASSSSSSATASSAPNNSTTLTNNSTNQTLKWRKNNTTTNAKVTRTKKRKPSCHLAKKKGRGKMLKRHNKGNGFISSSSISTTTATSERIQQQEQEEEEEEHQIPNNPPRLAVIPESGDENDTNREEKEQQNEEEKQQQQPDFNNQYEDTDDEGWGFIAEKYRSLLKQMENDKKSCETQKAKYESSTIEEWPLSFHDSRYEW
jgi:hypothetical protein